MIANSVPIISDHWLAGVKRSPSPNQGARPSGVVVDLLVIHNISLPPGEFGGHCIEQFFMNCLDSTQHPYFETIADLQVSAHLLIERDGRMTQFVPFDRRAWHAGVSEWQGRCNCNDYSVGIELEGTDLEPYTDAQYQALVAVTLALQSEYPGISTERVVGHSDIAPGRKSDPGAAFDWARFKQSLKTASQPEKNC